LVQTRRRQQHGRSGFEDPWLQKGEKKPSGEAGHDQRDEQHPAAADGTKGAPEIEGLCCHLLTLQA
jgi:hypothetical protein